MRTLACCGSGPPARGSAGNSRSPGVPYPRACPAPACSTQGWNLARNPAITGSTDPASTLEQKVTNVAHEIDYIANNL